MTAILEHSENTESEIKIADMQKTMVEEAIEVTRKALKKHEIESEIARYIK